MNELSCGPVMTELSDNNLFGATSCTMYVQAKGQSTYSVRPIRCRSSLSQELTSSHPSIIHV